MFAAMPDAGCFWQAQVLAATDMLWPEHLPTATNLLKAKSDMEQAYLVLLGYTDLAVIELLHATERLGQPAEKVCAGRVLDICHCVCSLHRHTTTSPDCSLQVKWLRTTHAGARIRMASGAATKARRNMGAIASGTTGTSGKKSRKNMRSA